MSKKPTLQEWILIGNKTKEIAKALNELQSLMSKQLPKTKFFKEWSLADKTFGQLRSHLDDIACTELSDTPDKIVTNIFYP